MDGVGGYEDVATLLVDLHADDHKVVYMLQIIPYPLFVEATRNTIADDNVAGCARGDLVGDVIGHAELAVIPADFDALCAEVDVGFLRVGEEILGTLIEMEGDARGPVVANEDIQ